MPLTDLYDNYIIDLDGVVHVGWSPLPGAVETLQELTRRGKGVVYLTNEPRYARASITARLRGFGLSVSVDSVITAGWAGALAVSEGGAAVYVIGSAELRAEVARAGGTVLSAADASSADRILVAGHSDFSYAELRAACRATAAELFATNRDPTFPMPDGPWPATGAILAAVETALGRTATVLGKPEPPIFRLAQSRLGSGRTVVVGDTPGVDVLGGRRAGLATVLVGSALTTAETRPDHAVADLAGLLR
ncbi:HAD-IIA family hydrolase [Actinokineospora globicatena]|uniref:Acid sugar phosphatase n=1 Tax=Actinokineospora globicatena TaxID=103729 RepID=A0A9W6QLD3_9PSEU|nr:HAD-IIA family hydrolase [Actinokineospora globicatena]GLW90689.1 acid sugar phosphatase [Actinokineospora globicatena]